MQMEFYENELGKFVVIYLADGDIEIRPLNDLETARRLTEMCWEFDPQETEAWSDAFFLHEMRIQPL